MPADATFMIEARRGASSTISGSANLFSAHPSQARVGDDLDSTGVDIRAESQGQARRARTIQHNIIERLQRNPMSLRPDLMFSTGPAAKTSVMCASGIYFSTKWANDGRLTAEQYARFVRPFDLQVLEAAKPMWCNMLHLCEDSIRLDAMGDYPVQVFHWDRSAGHNPTLGTGSAELGKCVGGGVDARTLRAGTPDDVEVMARSAIKEMKGRALLLGPGCSVQVARTPEANLDALRAAVER